MQQVGSVHSGARGAYTGGANADGAIGNHQTRRNAGSSAKTESAQTSISNVNPPEAASADKLLDAIVMSFINWFSEQLKTIVGTKEWSISSDMKLVSGTSLKIIAAAAAESTTTRIGADPDISFRAQANVMDDAALHLLSAGALAETIPEPGQKHQNLIDPDDAGARARAKVLQMPL